MGLKKKLKQQSSKLSQLAIKGSIAEPALSGTNMNRRLSNNFHTHSSGQSALGSKESPQVPSQHQDEREHQASGHLDIRNSCVDPEERLPAEQRPSFTRAKDSGYSQHIPPLRSNTSTSNGKILKEERHRATERPLHQVDGNSGNYSENGRDNCSQERALREAYEQDQHIKTKMSKELQAQDEKLQELKEQLQEKQDRISELERAWNKSTAALSRLQRGDSNYKVDDQTIRSLYQELIYNVECWTINHCKNDITNFKDSDWNLFRTVTPYGEDYSKSNRLRPLLIQSAIMWWLVCRVLNFSVDTGLLWAGDLSQSLCKIKDILEPGKWRSNESELCLQNQEAGYRISELLKREKLRPVEVRNYSAWKAKSALLITEVIDPQEIDANIERVTSGLKLTLSSFVPDWTSQAWGELKDIVKKATKLDEEMNKSRAFFDVKIWSDKDISKGLRFDDSSMESYHGFEKAQPGATVELVIAPGLIKTGTADGDLFEKSSVLTRWTVLCSESRKALKG